MSDSVYSVLALSAYAVVLIAVGFFARKNESLSDFLIASKSLGGWSSALTIFASKVGAGLLLTFSALVFLYGYWAMSLFAGFIGGYVIFYFYARRVHAVAQRDHNVYTMAGYYEHIYRGAGRYIAVAAFLTMFGWVLTNFIGGGQLLASISGVSFETAVFFTAGIVFLYVMLAGFVAVVRTDVIQSVAMVILLAVLVFVVVNNVDTVGIGPAPETIPFGKIAIFFITGILFPLGSAELWERVIATRDLRTLRQSLIIASVGYVVIGVLLGIVSLTILNIGLADDPNQGLVVGLQALVPSGYSWLVALALGSAILSSADTFVYSASALFAQNLLGNRRTPLKRRRSLTVICAAIISGGGALLAILLRNIIDVTFIFASITLGLGLVAFTTWVYPKLSSRTVTAEIVCLLVSIVAGFLAFGVSELLAAAALLGVMAGLLIGGVLGKFQSR